MAVPTCADVIRATLATGKGIRKTARGCGVGTSVVQRIRAAE
jgi:hypothetical protein